METGDPLSAAAEEALRGAGVPLSLTPNMLPRWTPCLLLLLVTAATAAPTPLYKLSQPEIEACLAADAEAVLVGRRGLREIVGYLDRRPEIFPEKKITEPRLLRREEKEAVWAAWQRGLDYLIALDAIQARHNRYYRLKGGAEESSFLIGYAAMLAEYRAALEFIKRADRNPEIDKVLNEAVPELGLPANTYAKMRFRFLNVVIATQFAAREVVRATYADNRLPEVRAVIAEDAGYLWKQGRGSAEVMTVKNAVAIVRSGVDTAWLPVQTGVSEWMGDTKVYRVGRSLISPAQVGELERALQPGDVLVERREWYLSNVGLPGYWSHAALYLGTAEDRRASFGADPAVQAWVKGQGEASGDFENLVQQRCPAVLAPGFPVTEKKDPARILEAISEGVTLTTLEHTADCDSIAVLRPRRSALERAQALVRALHYAGRPYDFSFDFATDAELVCTELVYKAYEPRAGYTGLKFELKEMLGRLLLPANDIVKQYAAAEGTPDQQLDLVMFLDGQERQKQAVVASAEVFRTSWQRPKWHALTQD